MLLERSRRYAALFMAVGCLFTGGCKSKSACVKNGAVVTVAGSHPHEVTIPAEHIARGVGGVYPVRGQTGHSHVIHLSDAEMRQLAAGTPVQTRTSSVDAHVHEVEVSCKE